MFEKIIVSLDGSDPSWQALTHAGEIGGKFGGSLVLVHVIQPFYSAGFLAVPADNALLLSQMDEMKNNAEDIINKAKDKLSAYPYEIKGRIETGQPSERILKVAEEEGGALIVMGSRGLSALAEFVLGSVSSNVAQYAKVPVLIVKDSKQAKK
jgi:nucleotide-binding universal stress UspA family protein